LLAALAICVVARGFAAEQVAGEQGAVPQASAYVSYPLGHASVDSVRQTLAQLLGDRRDVRVVGDASGKQLLVAGPADAQQLARQLVDSLDRAPAAGAAVATALRTYAYTGADGHRAVARLQQLLGAAGQVAFDARTKQIVVVAPAEAQARAAELLGAELPAGTEAAAAEQSRFQSATVQLKHSQAARVETLLKEMFARRLGAASQAPGELPAWVLTANGERVQIEVDSRQNRFTIHGSAKLAPQVARLIAVLDSPRPTDGRTVRIVPLSRSNPAKVQQAVEAYRGDSLPSQAPAAVNDQSGAGATSGVSRALAIESRAGQDHRLVRTMFQPEMEPPPEEPQAPLIAPSDLPPASAEEEMSEAQRQQLRELGADVEIETLGDLDVVILRGRERDVNELIRIIEEIERISADSEPQIELVPLQHAGSASVGRVVTQIQTELLTGRQGRATAIAVSRPNAMLVIGWGEAMNTMRELIGKLDQPVSPDAQVRVFRLEHASATALQNTLQDLFRAAGTTAAERVIISADTRSNSLVVQGSPSELAEVEVLLERLDVAGGSAVSELRVVRLRNTLALDLAPVLQLAMTGVGSGIAGAGAAGAANQRQESLEFLTLDAAGRQLLKSGALSDVRIVPEPRTNSLLVSAPPESLDLIVAVIEQLDSQPASTAQIKVFRVTNGDAVRLVEMLQALLGTQATLPGGPQLASAANDPSLAPLRFSVDQRTNSIIATGAPGDLTIVEAILLRLDESDIEDRKSTVIRLKNAPSTDVAQSINEFLRSERRVMEAAPGSYSPFQQIEAEVVVVPEPVSNSLIISATPRYYDDIIQLVEQLDAQPAQVMIQVLIAEVRLDNFEEFGAELGIQDAVLFDRSLLSNIVPSGATRYADILSADQTPGFDFNAPGAELGNSAGSRALENAGTVGAQGLSSFSVGRMNTDRGFGGLVLSASSENVSILIRALREKRRLDILSRPQVMTLDNQPAFIQVGQQVPRVALVSLTALGQVSNIDLINVGLILGVTPRISPDGMVVMEIDAERSELGPVNEGIPISTSSTGEVIRSPVINTTRAQTTVSAVDGQTIVLGGLISQTKRMNTRRVPWLSDVPLLGMLFRYDLMQKARTELLIILTPHVVRNEADANQVKQMEAARMSWCLADVEEIQGETGIHRRGETEMDHSQTQVIYPDMNPRGVMEAVETPMEMGPALPGPNGEVVLPPGAMPGGTVVAPPGALEAPPPAVPYQPAPGEGAGVKQGSARPVVAKQPSAGGVSRLGQAMKWRPQFKLSGAKAESPPAEVKTTVYHGPAPTVMSRLGPRPDVSPYLPKPAVSKASSTR
jgi:type II secretion system protein D